MKTVKDLTPEAVAILVKTSELLKEHHTTGSYARDKRGMSVSPTLPDAACFCGLGGVFKVATDLGVIENPSIGALITKQLKDCGPAMEVIDLLAQEVLKALNGSELHYEPTEDQVEAGEAALGAVILTNDYSTSENNSTFLATLHKLADEARPSVVDFLRLWLAWAEAGGSGLMFDDRCGLCWNYMNAEWEPHNLRDQAALAYMLDAEFRSQSEYPFGGHDVYQLEKLEDCAHRNPLRLAWVKRKIQEAA